MQKGEKRISLFVRPLIPPPPPRFSSPLRRVRGAKKTDSAAVGRTLRQNLFSVNGGKHFAQSYLRPDSSPLPALNATFERGMRGWDRKKAPKSLEEGLGAISPPLSIPFSLFARDFVLCPSPSRNTHLLPPDVPSAKTQKISGFDRRSKTKDCPVRRLMESGFFLLICVLMPSKPTAVGISSNRKKARKTLHSKTPNTIGTMPAVQNAKFVSAKKGKGGETRPAGGKREGRGLPFHHRDFLTSLPPLLPLLFWHPDSPSHLLFWTDRRRLPPVVRAAGGGNKSIWEERERDPLILGRASLFHPATPGQCKKVGPNWTLDGDAQIDPRPFPRPSCSKAKTECTASVSNSSFPSCEVPPPLLRPARKKRGEGKEMGCGASERPPIR